jgi:hypothetical protein
MPDDCKSLAAESGREADDVIGKGIEAIGGDPGGLVGQVAAALVRRDDPQPGFGKRRDLMSPAVPELRKAVQQHDHRAVFRSGRGDMQTNAGGQPHIVEGDGGEWVH